MKPLPVAENEIHLPARPARIHPVLEWLLRYLSIIGLCFWMGGFTFYAGVVIHVGHRVFGGHREIGFLTREVTLWLNRSGVIVLLILLANHLYDSRKTSGWLKNIRLATLLLMAGIQVALFVLHPKLDQLLDLSRHAILNHPDFKSSHLLYINLSAFQWAAALIHLAAILFAWKQKDEGKAEG
jgi:hypothetical protein